MKKYAKEFLLIIIGILFIFSSVETPLIHAAENIHRVYDNAGILTDSEIKQLENEAEYYTAKRDINYLIVTTNNAEGGTTAEYSDKFFKQFLKEYPDLKDCVILTIDMDNSYANINGQGIAEKKLDSNRCTKAANKISSNLKVGDYFQACLTYMKTVHNYLGVAEGVDPESPFLKLWFQALVSIIIGAIAVGIMLANTGGKVTVDQGTYLDQSDSRILARRDQYLHTTTSRVPKPKPSENNGGGSGGNSSGGSGSNGGCSF